MKNIKKNTPEIIKYTQILADTLIIILAFSLSYALRIGLFISTDFPFSTYFNVFFPASILWIIVLILQKHYEGFSSKTSHVLKLILSNSIGITFFVLIFFYKREIFFSRLILVYTWNIANILLILNMLFFDKIKFYIYNKKIGTRKALIVGSNKTSIELIENFQKYYPYYEVVAVIDTYGKSKINTKTKPYIKKMTSIDNIIKKYKIQSIIQTDNIEQSINLIQLARKNKIEYLLAPQLLGIYKKNVESKIIGKKSFIYLNSKFNS